MMADSLIIAGLRLVCAFIIGFTIVMVVLHIW